MSTLRQGNNSISQFYDEVEKKLTLLVNKTQMTYANSPDAIKSMTEKHRADALRVFISGLNRPLSDTLFSAQPATMPAALVLAQELSVNHARYRFAAAFNNQGKPPIAKPKTLVSPHYRFASREPSTAQQDRYPQPMEVDPSTSRFRQNQQTFKNNSAPFSNRNSSRQYSPQQPSGTNLNNARHNFAPPQFSNYTPPNGTQGQQQNLQLTKRQRDSERTAYNNNKFQRINLLQDQLVQQPEALPEYQDNWEKWSDQGALDVQDNIPVTEGIIDQINFLEEDHSCHM